MKKIYGLIVVVAVIAMAIPASAFENQFGGYFRTRMYSHDNFNSAASVKVNGAVIGTYPTDRVSKVDSRTRLYYTAVFSDDFKFVNKFEFNTTWGSGDLDYQTGPNTRFTSTSYGDIGADGNSLLIKNTYLDMNFGAHNVKVGTQGGTIARGFLFDDDFSGINATFNAGNVAVPVMWIKHTETGYGNGFDQGDRDYYVVAPVITMDTVKLNPYLLYDRDGDADINRFFLGMDADMTMDTVGLWASLIYEFGDAGRNAAGQTMEASAYLAAVGGNVNLGAADLHGQIFYASGDDNPNDTDVDEFGTDLAGRSYYWAEIMGYGIFDDAVSGGSCADGISNITAANIGASMSPMDKLTLKADLWWAMLNEVAPNADDDLGIEVDLAATYMLMDNLALDVVAAYLFAGDATNPNSDPYELGAQLSVSF